MISSNNRFPIIDAPDNWNSPFAPQRGVSEHADVVLLKMPNHNTDYPHLATPTLTASLRRAGYAVKQADINVQLRDYLVTQDRLNQLTYEFLPALARHIVDSTQDFERIRHQLTYLLYLSDNIGFDRIEEVKQRMQRREYADIFSDLESANVALLLFVLTGMLHNIVDWCITADEVGLGLNAENPVSVFLHKKLDEVVALSPRLVGFSVIQIQRKASCWFAKRLKERIDATIAFGGPDVSTFEETYLENFEYVDIGFLKEAETSFERFLKGDAPASIDGVVYRDVNGKVCKNWPNYDKSHSVFRPDFDDYSLDTFLLPTLPISTSRGCHFAKCTFCNHYKTYSGYYSNNAIETVDHLEYLSKRYNTKFFHFVDDMLEITAGNAIADEVLARGLDLSVLTYARFERGFDDKVLAKWKEAGIRVIEWGLESASEQILQKMVKGIAMHRVQKILEQSAEVGIVNKLMMFHNYPGETVEDLSKSIEFVSRNTRRRRIRPFFTLRGKLELRLHTPLEMTTRTSDDKTFIKRFDRSSNLDSLFGYADTPEYKLKEEKLEVFMKSMSEVVQDRNVFSTNDENISLDLVLLDLIDQGHQPAINIQ